MPEFVAVCCVECSTFQSIQNPKSKSFQCRVCTRKQSIRKVCVRLRGARCDVCCDDRPSVSAGQVFAKSDAAKDVREVVMKLNMRRGERAAAAAAQAFEVHPDDDYEDDGDCGGGVDDAAGDVSAHNDVASHGGSRWQRFLEVERRGDDAASDGGDEYVTELPALPTPAPKKRARQLDTGDGVRAGSSAKSRRCVAGSDAADVASPAGDDCEAPPRRHRDSASWCDDNGDDGIGAPGPLGGRAAGAGAAAAAATARHRVTAEPQPPPRAAGTSKWDAFL
jgi:hypothetical protein